MARYLETAAEAQGTIDQLLSFVPEEHRKEAAVLIAHTMNYGIRCCPRAVQSTVRLNAIRTACKNLPVSISLEEKEGYQGKTYKVLRVVPIHK